ncbi:MAG TPA: FAD:protein FMN transferase [Bryobacteraceae bacterium]|nr:FAD:protein FMN transferase [Bryobacteraceae bacterium]
MSHPVCTRSQVVMDTLVTMHVARSGADAAIERAFGWFYEIEERCTRFDRQSELMQLTSRIGAPVPVSAILFESVRFALMVAEETRGAFDPTVGRQLEERGFNREHRTGETIHTAIASEDDVSYRDVHLDLERRTITLQRPLILDLGAVVKGLAMDTAARELQPFADFSIDAGGDLYLGGCNRDGAPWRVGIRHPRRDNELICLLRASNQAVCTSGDYERGPHILDPRTGTPVGSAASVTVVAPNAMLADALSTAAFVLGPAEGIALLDRMGVDGLIVTPELERYETPGLRHAA